MNIKQLGSESSLKSICDAINDFLFHCQYEKNLSAKTIKAYSIDLFQFTAFLEKQKIGLSIKCITRESLKSYLQGISNFKPKTIKRKVASLKAMLNYLEYEDDNYINPFRKIKIRLKEPNLLPSVMTLNEVRKILNVMYLELENNQNKNKFTYKAQTRNVAIVEILFSTGMRVSEICNLKFRDINLKSGVVKIFGKGSKERMIQICQSEVLSIIKIYYQLHKNHINSESFFFINRLGLPLSAQSVRLMVKNYVHKAGLNRRITPHCARHRILSFAL